MSMSDDLASFDRIGYLLAHRRSTAHIEAQRILQEPAPVAAPDAGPIIFEPPPADYVQNREAYPGVLVLPDELGARRNAVLAAISEAKLIRLDAAGDASRLDFLAQAFADYQNLRAQNAPVSGQQEQNYRDYLALQMRQGAINAHAAQLERAALLADMDRLAVLASGLSEAWPA